MTTTHEQIASRLESAFTHMGFTRPSVADLKCASGVSLRTLYRHFPSKEAMVIGALEHRHLRYLAFLAEGEPPPGRESIEHMLTRLADWMAEYAPHGCMATNALAAYPDHPEIRNAVIYHKKAIAEIMGRRSGNKALAEALFLVHEGASAAWPLLGAKSIEAAREAVLALMEGRGLFG